MPFVGLRKEAAPEPTPEFVRAFAGASARLQLAADELAPRISTHGLDELVDLLAVESVGDDLAGGLRLTIEAEVEREFHRQLAFVDRRLAKAVLDKAASGPAKRDTQLDATKAWAADRAARRIKAVSASTKAAVRNALADGFEKGKTWQGIARDVKGIVGLHPRQAAALRKFTEEARAQGLAGARLEKAVAKRREQLLRYRAEMIARTETITAHAEGAMAAWRQARDDGRLDPGAKRKWLPGPGERTCPICGLLGKHDPVGLDEPFKLASGAPIMAPTAHPDCRCRLVLVG